VASGVPRMAFSHVKVLPFSVIIFTNYPLAVSTSFSISVTGWFRMIKLSIILLFFLRSKIY